MIFHSCFLPVRACSCSCCRNDVEDAFVVVVVGVGEGGLSGLTSD